MSTPAPVIFQPSTELSPVPSSQPLPRARSRTRSMPEPTHRSGVSSQDLIRMKPVPQPPQSSNSPPPPSSSSSQNYRTRAKSLAARKRSNRSSRRPTSPSRVINASIEYVCLSPDSYLVFIGLVLKERTRPCVCRPHRQPNSEKNYFALGFWRNLWSSLDFADKPVKDCVNLIHIDIIKIWDLDDRSGVSSFGCPYFNCSTESVSVKQPIQNKYVPRHQRSGCAGWRRVIEVSIHTKRICLAN